MVKNFYIAVLIILLLLTGGVIVYLAGQTKPVSDTPEKPVVIAEAMYQCSEGHTIKAVYTKQGPEPKVVPGEPPASNDFVSLSMDGAPSITLPQALSASGVRYTDPDEALVFWNKGAGALVLENGKEVTYKNCIEVKKDPGNLPQVYLDEVNHFTLRYPAGYTPDNSYVYNNLSPDTLISGVKFTIPADIATGTNLSSDSYISVEHRRDIQSCSANDFLMLPPNINPQVVTDGGFTYSVASTTDAGAGNRYEEWVYTIPGTSPCVAIRYFIHYTVFENYPAGTVTEFDQPALLAQYDAIRNSLTLDAQVVPPTLLISDVYPLYGGLTWQEEKPAEFADMTGYSVASDPLSDITDISAVTSPFEKYYADLLTKKGWKEDISMAADGPGSALISYKKANQYILLQYKSEFSVKNKNEPAQCPCSVDFSIFSGSK